MKNDVTKSSREIIESVVAGMAITDNFWGYLFGRVKKIETDKVPSIMGVGSEKNGSVCLYINPELVKNTDEKNLELVLEHEGLHLLNLHISRFLRIISVEVDEEIKNQKSMIWNLAADCAVNTQMKMPDKLKINGNEWPAQKPKLYEMPEDRSSESYYETLLKKNNDQCVYCGSSESDSDDQNSEGNDSQQDQQNEKDENQSEQQEGNDSSGSGQVTVESKCPCCGKKHQQNYNIDDHSDWFKDGGDSNNPEDIARKIEDQTKDLVRKSVKSFEASNKNRGHLPGHIKELIEGLLDIPKIPYYQIIRSMVKGSRLSKWKKSYTRVNKKRVYTFFDENKYINPVISPFPGKKRDFSFNIVVMIDTSASQSSTDIAEALSGIKDIIEQDRYCRVTVIEIDTQIGKEYEIKKVSDIDFEISGRGGTILKEGIVRAKEINPDITLAFTDGYCDNINEFPDSILPKKIIWCISEHGSSQMVNQTGPVVFVDPKD